MTDKKLKEEFPDLAQSVIAAVLTDVKGDASKARSILEDFSTDRTAQKKMVAELKGMIPTAKEEDLEDVLRRNGWNIEVAIGEAVELAEKPKRAEIQKLRKAEELRNLQVAFGRVNAKMVQAIFDKHEGDIDEATEEILKYIQEEEKKDAEKIRQREKDVAIDALLGRFPTLTFDQVSRAVNEHATQEAAAKALMDIQVENFRKAFPTLSEAEILIALQDNKWDFVGTTKALAQLAKKPAPAPVATVPKPAPIVKPVPVALPPPVVAAPSDAEVAQKQAEQREMLNDILRKSFYPGAVKPPVDEPPKEEKPAVVPERDSKADPKEPVSKDLEISLEAPERVDLGNKVEIIYHKTKGFSNSWDWIGLYKVGSDNYITYQWRPASDKATITFVAPSEYGSYEFRYITSTKVLAAVSNKMVVGPDIQLTLEEKEDHLQVKWLQKSGNIYPSAWIGFYKKAETANEKYFDYLRCKDAIANTLKFKKPTTAGQFEFRFFNTSSYAHAASLPYLILGDDKIEASVRSGNIALKLNLQTVDPTTDKVWVGIFFASEARNNYYRRYKKVSRRDEELLFTSGPRTAGIYEARVFANGSYDLVVKSSTFEVKAPAK